MIHSTSSFLLTNLSAQLGACDDNYVGEITYVNGSFTGPVQKHPHIFCLLKNHESKQMYTPQNRNKIDYVNFNPAHKGRKIIVVLLESPHIEEFNPMSNVQRCVTTGPALGNSGDRFNSQFIQVLTRHSSLFHLTGKKRFDVYLVNAIQYQCSLGKPKFDRVLRDKIFKFIWNTSPNSFEDDLVDRLNIIKPNIIINACTKNLQPLCQNAISKLATSSSIISCTASAHISAWDKNTQLK